MGGGGLLSRTTFVATRLFGYTVTVLAALACAAAWFNPGV